jgi:glycosyltransferase involved in cell wall biosynthesis
LNQPLFTVYILNYNYGRYLQQAVESLVGQLFRDFEFFVIDDGSTDNSVNLIKDLQKKYKFEAIFQQNMGMMKSLNHALSKAKGRYIIRLDADDWFADDALLKYAEVINTKEFSYLFSACCITDEKENIIKTEGRDMEKEIAEHIPNGACIAISVARLRAIGGYDETYSCQDGTYIWKCFHKEAIAYIDEPLFYYRRHTANMTLNEAMILKEKKRILND